jgi:hypothetical protein
VGVEEEKAILSANMSLGVLITRKIAAVGVSVAAMEIKKVHPKEREFLLSRLLESSLCDRHNSRV